MNKHHFICAYIHKELHFNSLNTDNNLKVHSFHIPTKMYINLNKKCLVNIFLIFV